MLILVYLLFALQRLEELTTKIAYAMFFSHYRFFLSLYLLDFCIASITLCVRKAFVRGYFITCLHFQLFFSFASSLLLINCNIIWYHILFSLFLLIAPLFQIVLTIDSLENLFWNRVLHMTDPVLQRTAGSLDGCKGIVWTWQLKLSRCFF